MFQTLHENGGCCFRHSMTMEAVVSDVDECHEEGKAYKHKCDVASTTCVNTVGNYSCTCKDGFIQKNFFSCEGVTPRQCDTSLTCHVSQ